MSAERRTKIIAQGWLRDLVGALRETIRHALHRLRRHRHATTGAAPQMMACNHNRFTDGLWWSLVVGRSSVHMLQGTKPVQKKEPRMERPKLTSETAESIINLLRDNPGVAMTLDQIADEIDLPVEDLGAHLDELVTHNLVEQETDAEGFDMYRFPDRFQRSTGAP
jgi:hypothetical protein